MLVAFLKSHDDKDCKCEIVKFIDRLWIEKSGDLSCIRTFIVHVKKDSPAPLKHVRMIIPRRETPSLDDLSYTCLDEGYLYNTGAFSTGGYSFKGIEPDQKLGFVNYDFFEHVAVRTDTTLKSFPSPQKTCRIISYDCSDNPLRQDEYRLFRCFFSVTSLLIELFPRTFNLSLRYFDKDPHRDEMTRLDDTENLEIPAVRIIDPETKQGGFDVFLHLPSDLSSTNFNELTQTTSKHCSDGSESEKPNQKFIWRARAIFPEDMKELTAGKSFFSVEGLINDPFEMEEIRSEIEYLKTDTRKLGIAGVKNLHIGYCALVAAIISIILVIFLETPLLQNVKTCFSSGKSSPSSLSNHKPPHPSTP